jgi:hypothetical protein
VAIIREPLPCNPLFTARRLKPGAWDQFRRAWDPGDDKPPGFQRAYPPKVYARWRAPASDGALVA